MPRIAYVQEPSEHVEERTAIFNDLIGFQDPDYAHVGPGDLVLTLANDGNLLPMRRWTVTALYEVTDWEETGDAILLTMALRLRLDEAVGDERATAGFDRGEMMADLSWFPSPAEFPKPFPFSAWAWLREEKGLPLPDLP